MPGVLPFVPVPLEGLLVPLPGDSVSHPTAFLLQKKKEPAGTHMRERERAIKRDAKLVTQRQRDRKNEHILIPGTVIKPWALVSVLLLLPLD